MALCRKVSAKESTPHDFLVSALGAGLYKLSKVSLGSETSWCLAPLPVSGSRLMALQRGASSTTPEIDQALASVRTSSKARVALPKRAPSAAKKVPTSVLIRPGMTIDERVAARAAAKVQQQALSAGQPQDNCLDSSWLVRIADALWQHSRSIADRQARLSAGRRTLSNTPCSSTLMDVLDYLSRSLGQQAATNQVEKTSRRQLVAALQEIAKTAGDWLQIHSETAEISKNSTVWIYPSQFKAARAKLMGQPLPKEATERPLKRPLTTNHESSNFATPSTTTVTPKTPIPIVTAEGSSSALLPIAKKQRLGPVVTTLASETTTPKKKPTLRINPFLILNESDYGTWAMIVAGDLK